MKVECLHCGNEFEGSISLDELGWHSYCEECDQSFDVDVIASNNSDKKYYEIEFDNDTRCRDDTDETVGEYSICIIGKRKPSYKEAEEFCKEDMKITGYKHVVAIREIDAYEAHTFFDMENEDKFPAFE